MARDGRPHGHFLAGEAGELAGVSGTTIGQWARWGYIRASQSAGDPHVYSVEDVAEAAIVSTLLERGVRHADVRRAIARLDLANHACGLGGLPPRTPARSPRVACQYPPAGTVLDHGSLVSATFGKCR